MDLVPEIILILIVHLCEYSLKTDAKMVFCSDYSMMIIISVRENICRDENIQPGFLHAEFFNYLIFLKSQDTQFLPHFNKFLKGCLEVMHLMTG